MERPKVSIVVPIYKTEKYLNRCLQSLKEQTLNEIEIILVDDDSPDRCPEICDKAAAEDTRIKVIHKTNEGAGMAKNSGIESATGEYIGFIDIMQILLCRECVLSAGIYLAKTENTLKKIILVSILCLTMMLTLKI